jgi:ABC-type Zn uptake system ZnuABC Zn-binding protein ZnuA
MYVSAIKEALIQLRPNSKSIFEKNASTLILEIRNIHNNYRIKFKNKPTPRWIITPHNGFYHLAKAYGFEYIYLSNFDHNENLSAMRIKQLIEQIKPLKNVILFNEWGIKSPLLSTIQTETQKKNGGYLIGDSLTQSNDSGSTIQDYLKYNNEILLKNFQ